MSAVRKVLGALVLGLAMVFSVVLGAVFPVPPLAVLVRRRRTDPIELVMPAVSGTGLDLGRTEVPAALLDTSRA
jgi:hypothetical protein